MFPWEVLATSAIRIIELLCAALITYRLIPYLKTHTSEKQQKTVGTAVRTAVYAVEKVYKRLGWSAEDKKKNAMEYAREELTQYGVHVSDRFLESQIEAVCEGLDLAVSQLCGMADDEKATTWEKLIDIVGDVVSGKGDMDFTTVERLAQVLGLDSEGKNGDELITQLRLWYSRENGKKEV